MTFELFALYVIIIIQGFLISRQLYLLSKYSKKLDKPNFKINFIRKDDNMTLIYGLACSAPVDGDVVERKLSMVVNDGEPVLKVFAGDATDLGEISLKQGDYAVLELVDVDDSGNESEPAVLTLKAADTIPPSVPGGFTVSLLREVEDVVPDTPDEPEAE